MLKMKLSSKAFTLIELLTVIAVIGVLAAIVIPIIGKAGVRASFVKDSSNLRQLGIANQLYMQDHQGRLVANFAKDESGNITDQSWTYNLMPYIEGHEVVDTEAQWVIELRPGNIYNTPARTDYQDKVRSYGLNYQLYKADGLARGVFLNIPTPANIIHIGPTELADNQWMRSSDGVGVGPAMKFYYGNLANVLYVDGHVDAHSAEELVMEPAEGESKFRWW
jgi:prepilin-type N-terminal cleavage/methylation domain-containing protein/prepilin-type processing-associated H-X9-DG protein